MIVRYEWHPTPNYSTPQYHKQIALHTSEGATTMSSLANWVCQAASQVSYHFCIDNVTKGLAYQFVDTEYKSWAQAAYNPNGLTACFCTPSGASSGWNRDKWLNDQMLAMENMAAVVGDQARKYGIPLVAINTSQAQAGAMGVCQHFNYGSAGSNHTDCGQGFPLDVLIDLAKGGSAPPVSQPVPKYREEYQSMLVTFGSDGRASLPVPAAVKAIRFTSGDDTLLNINWVGSGESSRDYETSQQTRSDVNMPKGQTGVVLVTRRSGSAPVYCAWIAS
jgi:hypothetical protein